MLDDAWYAGFLCSTRLMRTFSAAGATSTAGVRLHGVQDTVEPDIDESQDLVHAKDTLRFRGQLPQADDQAWTAQVSALRIPLLSHISASVPNESGFYAK